MGSFLEGARGKVPPDPMPVFLNRCAATHKCAVEFF
jgi:hypothetical protein